MSIRTKYTWWYSPSNRKWPGETFIFEWGTKMPMWSLDLAPWPLCLFGGPSQAFPNNGCRRQLARPTTCSLFIPNFLHPPPFFWKAIWQALQQRWISQDNLWKKAWFDTYQGNEKGFHLWKNRWLWSPKPATPKPWIATWDQYSGCLFYPKYMSKSWNKPSKNQWYSPPFLTYHCIIHPHSQPFLSLICGTPTLASALWRCVLATSTRRCASVAKRKAWKRLGCNWAGCISLSLSMEPSLRFSGLAEGYVSIYIL